MSKLSIKHGLAWLGALRLTLWLLGLLTFSVALTYLSPALSSLWLALPLLLLALNLLAAILSNAKFRQQLPLLSFHIALLVLLLLVATGQMSSLKGQVEVTEGERFSGQLTDYQAGPLHHWQLEKVQFFLDSFSIDYAPRLQRGVTEAKIQWLNEAGELKQGHIGDHRPLIINGYHFYTSHNKGFAPIFSWTPKRGDPVTGSIHLPAYPANEFNQALEWSPTNSDLTIWTQLQFDEVILDPEKASQFRLPKKHSLVIRIGEQRHELVPGDAVNTQQGRLVYDELRTWMGFTVSSDWTLPWLFAAGFFAVLSMAWYYWNKFNSRPWRDEL